MESCFGKEKTGCKLKRQMIIYNEIYRKKCWDNKKSEKISKYDNILEALL